MRKYYFLFIILYFYSAFIAKAQVCENRLKTDTTYTFISQHNHQKLSISLVDNNSNSNYSYPEYQVKVYNSIGDIIQMFSKINYFVRRKSDFRLMDANFDNYDDLLVLVNPNSFNTCYEFWMFDTISQKYNYDSLFSEVVSCNPDFNPNARTISTSNGDGRSMTFWNATYLYDNRNLILIEEESQEQFKLIDSTNYIYNYRRIKKARQGNKMVIVKEMIGTLEEVENGWNK